MILSHLRAFLAFSTTWSRWISSGITPDSASSTAVLVALYAPVIDCKHLFCNTVNFVTGAVSFSHISFSEYHIEAP